MCKKAVFPHIANFVDEETKNPKFAPALQIVHKAGAFPSLTLTTADGKKEDLVIDKWKTEHLTQFFEGRLAL